MTASTSPRPAHGPPVRGRDPSHQRSEDAWLAGYRDGFEGRPPPDIHESLVDAYADGRRVGTARSGRLPPPRPGLFDSPFCREVLSRPYIPSNAVTQENPHAE